MPSGLGGYATSTNKRGPFTQPAQPQPSALGENEWEKGPLYLQDSHEVPEIQDSSLISA